MPLPPLLTLAAAAAGAMAAAATTSGTTTPQQLQQWHPSGRLVKARQSACSGSCCQQWPTCTASGSCTVTSSSATCCIATPATSCCAILAWPGGAGGGGGWLVGGRNDGCRARQEHVGADYAAHWVQGPWQTSAQSPQERCCWCKGSYPGDACPQLTWLCLPLCLLAPSLSLCLSTYPSAHPQALLPPQWPADPACRDPVVPRP